MMPLPENNGEFCSYGKREGRCHIVTLKIVPPPFFFFAAVSAEKWLHPVFILELCSLWYLSSKLKAVSYQLSWRICCGKSRRLGPCHLNEKGGMWNSSEYCECMVGARSCGPGPLWQEFRGQKPSQASSSASAVISLPPTRFFPTGQLLQQLILRLPHANVSGSQPPLWCEVRSWLSFSRSSVPPPPHLLLKRQLCFHVPFFLKWFSPESAVTSGCWTFSLAPPPLALSALGCGWSLLCFVTPRPWFLESCAVLVWHLFCMRFLGSVTPAHASVILSPVSGLPVSLFLPLGLSAHLPELSR